MYLGARMKSTGHEGESVDWEEIRSFVVGQIKRAGRRVDSEKIRKYVRDRGGNFDSLLNRLERSGFLAKGAGSSSRASGGNRFAAFRRYRDRLERKVRRAATGFRSHLTVMGGFSLFLLMIWAMTGGGFPWFLIPAAASTVGLANHANALLHRRREAREVEQLPDLGEAETESLVRFHSARSAFGAHAATTLSLSFLFLVIWAITGGFPWFLISSGAVALSLLFHYSAYASQSRSMRRQFSDIARGRSPRRLDSSKISIREPTIVREADAVRGAILRQAESAKADGVDMGDDLGPLLDTYVEQIRTLALKYDEMAAVASGGGRSRNCRMNTPTW